MPQELLIQKLDDLSPALDALLSAPPTETFLLHIDPALKFTIKLEGKSWDGMIDIRVARYVTELQRTVDRVRRETGVNGDKKPLVKVEIKDGSTELEPQIVSILGDAVRNMSSQQQFIIVLCIIGVCFAGWTIKQVLDFLKEKKNHDQQAELVRSMQQTLQYAIEKIDPERPIRSLVNTMEEQDTIKLPAAGSLTREAAKQKYPRKPRITPVNALIDDNYQVEAVSLENPVRFTLAKGDVQFRAQLAKDLPAEDTDAFVAKVKASLQTQTSLRVALQIDAAIGDKSVAAAAIVGIGRPPRDGAEDLLSFFD